MTGQIQNMYMQYNMPSKGIKSNSNHLESASFAIERVL